MYNIIMEILNYDVMEILLELAYLGPTEITWLSNLYMIAPIIEVWKLIVIGFSIRFCKFIKRCCMN